MPAKKSTRRLSTTRSQGAKPRLDQELIDDQKFQQKLEAKRFTDRIEREANEAMLCLACFSSDWRMQPKYLANFVANSLIATLVCLRCKRKIPFETQIGKDPDQFEEDEEEADPIALLFGIRGLLGTGRSRARRRHRLDIDQRLRLLAHLH
jgi:hypothetical protein